MKDQAIFYLLRTIQIVLLALSLPLKVLGMIIAFVVTAITAGFVVGNTLLDILDEE